MLPILSGYEVLSQLRKANIFTPVLILTAKDGLADKLKGFQEGADDYLVKPFEKEELLARIEAMFRRTNRTYLHNEVQFKELRLDVNERKAYVGEHEIYLQGKQFDMFHY